MRKIKNILLLAGGDSTRFWPLKNKVLWSFLGQPLIKHITDYFLEYGENIFVVVNKLDCSTIKKIVNEKIQLVVQQQLSGMGGAILSCQNKVKGEVLIVNGSDIFNPYLINQLINQLKSKPEIILVAKKYKDYFPGGYLKYSHHRLVEIVEKPGKEKTPSNLVRLVFDYFHDSNKLFNILKKRKTNSDDWYETSINQLIKVVEKVKVLDYDDYLYPVKYPWHILPLTNFFLKKITKNNIDKSAQISSSAIIVPPVHIGKHVKVGDFAKIVGPTYIDDNTFVADHTLIYQSHLGKSCLIGGYSEVTRSYLSEGVMLHRNYVGDSVLASHVLMGAQAATANFRFDGWPIADTGLIKFGSIIGAKSKIGVNATLLPGVKIGSQTFIGPGEVVKKDIKDKMFVFNNKISINKI